MATTRILYKGKKELTMAQFEALTELDDAIDYDLVDFPNTAITNAQMTSALGYTRLFNAGEVFVCADDGTYTKGHTYQVKVDGDVKSWEDITPTSATPSRQTIQVETLPEPTAEYVDKIVQFVGSSQYEGQEPATGHWYTVKTVDASEGRYEWVKQSVQNKDYSVESQLGSGTIGQMKYINSSAQKYWVPYIALGELSQLSNYTQNITLNYSIAGEEQSQEMTYNADEGYWVNESEFGFYCISKLTVWFPSETFTKNMFMAVYQAEDLTPERQNVTITSITLADGTEVSIPSGFGEAKYYPYSVGNGYSLPIDFYTKFNDGTLTDTDLENFRFMAANDESSIFDINNLQLYSGGESGWQPIVNLLIPKSYRHFIQFTAGGYMVYYDFTSTRATSYTASDLPSMPENAISTFEIIANGKYSSVSGLIYRNGEGLLKAILHGLYTTDGTTQSYLELNGVDVSFVSDTVGEL